MAKSPPTTLEYWRTRMKTSGLKGLKTMKNKILLPIQYKGNNMKKKQSELTLFQ